jgi:hypothetical protein
MTRSLGKEKQFFQRIGSSRSRRVGRATNQLPFGTLRAGSSFPHFPRLRPCQEPAVPTVQLDNLR